MPRQSYFALTWNTRSPPGCTTEGAEESWTTSCRFVLAGYASSMSCPSGASVMLIVPSLFVSRMRPCSKARMFLLENSGLWSVKVSGSPPAQLDAKRSYR